MEVRAVSNLIYSKKAASSVKYLDFTTVLQPHLLIPDPLRVNIDLCVLPPL